MNAPAVAPPPPTRIERIARWIAICVIVGCVVVVWQRDRLRAAWWAHRLAESASIDEQNYCFTMLAGLRGSATQAAIGLMRDDRPHIRTCGSALAGQLPDDAAADALRIMLRDIWTEQDDAALAMTIAIGRMQAAATDAALIDLADRHPSPDVRAQAAEWIGLRRLQTGESVLRRLLTDTSPVAVELFAEQSSRGAAVFAAASRPDSVGDAPLTVATVAKTALDALQQPQASMPDFDLQSPLPPQP